MLAWLKAAHIATLCIWCAGLLVLPGLFIGRVHALPKRELKRLWHFTWIGYRVVMSPAAVLAIATGTGLIFGYAVFEPWLYLKLAVVGAMVALHMSYGLALARLAEPEKHFPRLAGLAMLGGATLLILAVLLLVLGKPPLDAGVLPDWMRQPGSGRTLLQSSLESMRPI
ncbi:CopD family protein [Pseudoroseomonas cervicalis]|uniref:CopD family protein n=1 Tax=Teichococcus cervicalis TaxID=204525 RepID=UPI0022F1478E|nr:CopD family protein [Pseudoroseomonas cervicalis]WBV43453.1 CopD family protein [Pseudoroseomonas cervicalis]